MPLVDLVDGEGRVIRVFEENGFNFPEASALYLCESGSLMQQQEIVRDMEIREDDILLCSYPKSGTHWVWEILSMLSKGAAEYEKGTKATQTLEILKKGVINVVPSPRVLNTHFPLHLLPRQMVAKSRKIVLLLRNPKDTAVSMYHMMRKVVDWKYDGSFRSYLYLFLGIDGRHFMYSWFDYVSEWETFIKENPDYPVLVVRFEDLKKNMMKEIKRIGQFLGTNTETLAAEIATKCKFENLKRANDEYKDDPTKDLSRDGVQFIYRKGTVGDWKNWFTVADSELFDAVYAKKMTKIENVQFKFAL